MATVRRAAFSILFAASAVVGACNAINGSRDRFLDDDAGGLPARPDGAKDDGGGGDGGTDGPIDQNVPDDGAPLLIPVDVGGTWASPNGATFATVDGGKKITAYDGGATHPVIVPLPQPNIPAEDYTVHATVRAPAALGEFGILTRLQPDESGVVLSSSYGQQANAFVGHMSSSDWNPTLGQQVGYTFVASARYRFQIKVTGKEVRAKFWVATDPEPTETQFLWPSSYATGRGVGFYTYGVVDAVLESMTITVP